MCGRGRKKEKEQRKARRERLQSNQIFAFCIIFLSLADVRERPRWLRMGLVDVVVQLLQRGQGLLAVAALVAAARIVLGTVVMLQVRGGGG